MSLVKAKLKALEGGEDIEFMYNPNQLAFSRSISLEAAEGARTEKGLNKVSFKHPNPYSLKISNILIDTYEAGKNVLDYVNKFKKAVDFAEQGRGQKKRPPIYLFAWGNQEYLRCFVKTLSYKLTLFLPDGTPVRAVVDLDLEEVDFSISQPGVGAPQVSSANRQSDNRSKRQVPSTSTGLSGSNLLASQPTAKALGQSAQKAGGAAQQTAQQAAGAAQKAAGAAQQTAQQAAGAAQKAAGAAQQATGAAQQAAQQATGAAQQAAQQATGAAQQAAGAAQQATGAAQQATGAAQQAAQQATDAAQQAAGAAQQAAQQATDAAQQAAQQATGAAQQATGAAQQAAQQATQQATDAAQQATQQIPGQSSTGSDSV